MRYNPKTTIENATFKFWSKVQEIDCCWIWPATQRNHKGYGLFYCDGKYQAAHRIAYRLIYGDFQSELFVLHRCDNPSCVNPFHLFLGTHRDNMDDRDAKGRTAKGDRSGARLHPQSVSRGEHRYNAKLTDEKVRQIRRMKAEGYTGRAIASHIGTDEFTVSSILRGKAWKHVV